MASPFSTSSYSSSATVRVDKATSELLIGPDWTMNIDICDMINSNHWQAKDVVKAVKRRLQHKNPNVQLLALTLLETMVKNCGDYVHFQIAERTVLLEMLKIVKKKADMQVREKILTLLDSWQEAFGGSGGKHPQYYWAYEELRRAGVEFPKRSLDAAPIFTPPVTHPIVRHPQSGYGMPSNSTRRLDEAMASEMESVSLASMDSMQEVMQLLADMLQAVDPSDRQAVKDEVIVDLVNQCRANQKRLMQMLTTSGDEELLGRGLELNDGLQSVLAKHDSILSGAPLPNLVKNSCPQQQNEGSSSLKSTELKETVPRSNATPPTPGTSVIKVQAEEEEDEEDDFAQLARRHSKTQATPSQSTSNGTSDSTNITTSMAPAAVTPDPGNALAVVPVSPAPVKTTKEQDMIDFLSLTLSTVSTTHEPQTPASNPNLHQVPVSTSHEPQTSSTFNSNLHQVPVSSTQGYPYSSMTYSGNQGQVSYSNYVVPWAQPKKPEPQPPPQPQVQLQPQPQQQPLPQPQPQLQPQLQSQLQLQPQPQQQPPPQPQPQLQPQLQPRPQYPQYSYGYPPPPWAPTPGYSNPNLSSSGYMYSTLQVNSNSSYMPMQGPRPFQHSNSFSSKESHGLAMNGDVRVLGPRNPAPALGNKPFIPSYRLFEDLNVLGNTDGRLKMASSASPSLSGTSSQGMVGGRQ